jgi:hypothetical protein
VNKPENDDSSILDRAGEPVDCQAPLLITSEAGFTGGDCGGVREELHCKSEGQLACRILDKGAGLAPAFSFAGLGPKLDGDSVR